MLLSHRLRTTLDPEEVYQDALNAADYRLAVGGLVRRKLSLSLRDLMQMPSQTFFATLECAGNGRTNFDPPIPGEKWAFGAVSTAEWTGVPLMVGS